MSYTAYDGIYISIPGVGVVDGLLYAVGGHDGPLVRNSVEMYNPESNTWTQLGDMHSCRRNAGRNPCLIALLIILKVQ